VARAGKIDLGDIEIAIAERTFVILVLVIGVSVFANSASADVDIYAAPQFGISNLIVDTDGNAVGGDPNGLTGDDTDSAPLLGLSVGVEVPMNELVPREWLADVRMPAWPMSFELEAAGLRDYDISTRGSGATAEVYSTEITATTLMANTWTDIPLNTMWRPVQYVFGLGRQPRVRQWLEPGSFYFGAGVGFVVLDIKGTDNVLSGKDDFLDFAWNVGAGFNYALNDRFTLSAGYRYLGLGPNTGNQEVDLTGGPGTNDKLEYDLQVHEFRVAIKIRLASFRGVWR
jgi:hypothetical protein